MQTDLIADILLSVTLSSRVQGRIAKNAEQEVKLCRSCARPPPPVFAQIFTLNYVFFLANFYLFIFLTLPTVPLEVSSLTKHDL